MLFTLHGHQLIGNQIYTLTTISMLLIACRAENNPDYKQNMMATTHPERINAEWQNYHCSKQRSVGAAKKM